MGYVSLLAPHVVPQGETFLPAQQGYLLMALQGRGRNVADLAFPSPARPHSWQGPDPSPDGARLVCLAWLVLPGRPASPSLKLLGTAEQGPKSWPKQVFLRRMGLALQLCVAAEEGLAGRGCRSKTESIEGQGQHLSPLHSRDNSVGPDQGGT